MLGPSGHWLYECSQCGMVDDLDAEIMVHQGWQLVTPVLCPSCIKELSDV